MNRIRITAFLVLFCTSPIFAQDGWLLSATPPLVIRFDRPTVAVNFTNPSDKVLHGITLNTVKDGQKASRVIIDTIQPHATFSIFSPELMEHDGAFLKELLSDSSVTCNDYSKPLKISITIQ